jgi:hypothetical protein
LDLDSGEVFRGAGQGVAAGLGLAPAGLQAVPRPTRCRQPIGHRRSRRVVFVHRSHGPLHVIAEHLAKVRISGPLGIVGSLYEAVNEAISELSVCTHPGVQPEHAGLTVRSLGVRRRSSEDLAPVPGQALEMIGMAGM